MSDTFEHNKPYSLAATYQDSPAPTALTAPYDLHATYDENATWGTDYISVQGFDTQVFGDHLVTYTQNISVIGYAAFEFGQPTLLNLNQFVQTSSIYDAQIGTASLINKNKWLSPVGFSAQRFGAQSIYNLTKNISLNNHGFLTQAFGTANIWNFNKEIKVTGFNTQVFGTQSKVYNLRQYLNLNSRGINSALYGTAYLQGGVKYVTPTGFNSSELTNPKVVNTKANQYIGLSGIPSPDVPSPNVSPRIIYVKSQIATIWGNALVQFPPHPKGFVATSYGVAWVSHSPRYLEPSYIDAFNSGYPKVFDPTQKIGVTGANTVIAGGIFGDILIRNTRRIIKVSGFYAQSFSDWGVVESNLRNIVPKGLDHQNFGSNAIRNKTPSIAPIGINSFAGLNPATGYRIRTIKPSGFYQPKFGTHILTKPPELKPSGSNQNIFGSTWISHKTRSIYAGLGRESLAIGESKIWHYSRSIRTSGLEFSQYGAPRVEHGRRTLLAKGSIHSVYGGSAWVSYAVRSLSPSSITYPNIPIHRVGGTQHIQPFGYIATLFGSRIVPESQSIYPQGFINPFGISAIDLWKKYIKPNGFLTTGQDGGHRFGSHKFWNLRQYIVQFYDGDSGLVPPKWTGWTAVANKNKTIGAIGNNFARIGGPNIENKARLLSPSGLSALTFGRAMIADRIRKLKLQGIEPPYMSSWSVIYNAAPVIAQKGFKADAFGIATILNTRRYFNRIGNFESLEFGKPMIADRIRTLKFEQRYTIAPPYMPIHKIHLYTRYIEEVGRFDDYQVFGNPSLSIHWNIITPRWALRDAYGTPTVKNLTPELGARGRNSEEFGQASIRTQWRELLQQGSETVVWGRSEVAFRDRQFSVNGFTQWAIPRHTVIKTGVPPYYPQYIWLDAVEMDGEQKGGHGIEIPDWQVPVPNIKTNVIFPVGFVASLYGSHYTQSNGILVQPGLQELTIGNHFVGLKNRNITVPSLDDLMIIPKPRLSPHTIYAVMESPGQARNNHPYQNIHYVNSDGGSRPPGEVFGTTRITLRHRKIYISGANQSNTPKPAVSLKKRYISVTGFNSFRMGWHFALDGSPQDVEQYDSLNMQAFGRPSVVSPYYGPQSIRVGGMNASAFGVQRVEHFHRAIRASGASMTAMGASRGGDTAYKPQSLWVGRPMPTIHAGFNAEKFGNTTIGLRVRDVGVFGFDAFNAESDISNFKGRLKVIQVKQPQVIEPKEIYPQSFGHTAYGVPDIRLKVHYIRPDGNSNQFRKGGST